MGEYGGFIEWIIGQAGIGGLAAFALWITFQVYRDAIRREQENALVHREDKLRMATVVEQLVQSNTEIRVLIQEMRDERRDEITVRQNAR